MQLRNYQQEAIKAVEDYGDGKCLVVLFTGAGKSVVSTRFKRQGKLLVLIHTIDLVEQNAGYFDNVGIESGSRTANGEDVIIATWQSMKNRLHKYPPNYFDQIQVDEAAHAASKEYSKVIQHFTPRQLIGLTATPNRADGVGLGAVFDKIVYEKDLQFGIKNGFLSKLRCQRVDMGVDFSTISKSMGDYSATQLAKAIKKQGANDIIADVAIKAEKPALVFACSIEHAKELVEKIPGAIEVNGKTKDRKNILQDFRDGKIETLVSVNLLLEGFDAPRTRTVVMARPTKSTSLYTQVVGRVLRLFEGKEYGTVVDMVGNTKNHDLCSAPTLLGFDLEGIPVSMIEDLEGDIFDLPEIIEKKLNTPEFWIRSKKVIDLFKKKHKLNLLSLSFVPLPNNELAISIPKTTRWIGIEQIDLQGETRIISNFTKPGPKRPAQECVDKIFIYLKTKHSKELTLLKEDAIKRWTRGRVPSQQQKNYCQGLLRKHGLTFDTNDLSMYEIQTLISRLKLESKERNYNGIVI